MFCPWKHEKSAYNNRLLLTKIAEIFIIFFWRSNLTKIRKTTRFIWVFIVLLIYNFGLALKIGKELVVTLSRFSVAYQSSNSQKDKNKLQLKESDPYFFFSILSKFDDRFLVKNENFLICRTGRLILTYYCGTLIKHFDRV